MSRLAVIPARGGSQRVPRKNVMPFRGRPMLAWTVDAAWASNCLDRVIVSSDDAEIRSAGLAAGAEAYDRSPDLASDRARVPAVCLDVLDREAAAGRRYDTLVVLYPTAPLRTGADIREVVALLQPGVCDHAMAVTHFDLPAHQALRRVGETELEPMWPDMVTARAADIGELVVDNGSTYAVTVSAFRAAPGFHGEPLAGHVMPRGRSVDVDEPDDVALLQFYAEQYGFPDERT